MTRKILAAALMAGILSTAPVSAEEESGDICASLARLAHTYAKGKYAGVPMGEAMAFATRDPESSLTPIYRAMVIDAYALPDFTTPEYQNRAMQEFSNEVALICYRDWGWD